MRGLVLIVATILDSRRRCSHRIGSIETRNPLLKSHYERQVMAKQETPPTAQPVKQPAQQPITLDESKTISCYANFCRVTGSPEELIVDFGMNAQPMGSNDKPVEIAQRIVLNFYTAKRLLHALHISVQRHEEVFGNIETDIQKRVKIKKEPQSS